MIEQSKYKRTQEEEYDNNIVYCRLCFRGDDFTNRATRTRSHRTNRSSPKQEEKMKVTNETYLMLANLIIWGNVIGEIAL